MSRPNSPDRADTYCKAYDGEPSFPKNFKTCKRLKETKMKTIKGDFYKLSVLTIQS